MQEEAGSVAMAAPVVSLNSISKSFAGLQALQDVTLDLHAGEVHVVMGENGAGKSTLMKILCGAYQADSGTFHYQGSPAQLRNPREARQLGIAVIFQEFSLVPHLDIAQNIFLGREPIRGLPGQIDRKRLYREAEELLADLDCPLDVRTPIYRLRVAEQQMVEIAKALSQRPRVLVLDEPTSALSDHECGQLFRIIAKLKANGVAMAYISHRMAEVFRLADRITVLRDGKRIGTSLPHETSSNEIVRMMVGRSVDMSYARDHCTSPGEPVIELRDVSAANGLSQVNLIVRRREIVGLTGLVGSGRTEVARTIFGADRLTGGEILLRGQRFSSDTVRASRSGIALIPENRKTEGLALIRSVRDNIVIAGLERLFPSGWFRSRMATAVASELSGTLRIATPDVFRSAGQLSGGNQQKVVIAKWLQAGAELFIFDEPTRGIDVRAKAEIFKLIGGLVLQGKAVLLISSELSEIVNVCDRAYVMKDKRVVGELDRAGLTQENVMSLAVSHG